MYQIDTSRITRLLKAWRAGDGDAHGELIPLVHAELQSFARLIQKNASGERTQDTSTLLHEAYIRLIDEDGVAWRDRAHFFAATAHLVRRVLVAGAADTADEQTLALDEAITRLAEIDPRRAHIVELRLFGGLDAREIAEVLGVPQGKVMRDWVAAKEWLRREQGRA